MELNDNEFDATFRKKVFDAEPQFEEAAWNKMEQKLSRRDRVVFFRKAGALCLLLLICFGGYLMFDEGLKENPKPVIAQKTKPGNAVPAGTVEIVEVPELTRGAEVHFFRKDFTAGFADSLVNKKNEDQLLSSNKDSISRGLAGTTPFTPGLYIKQDSGMVALPGSDVLPASAALVNKKQKTGPRRAFPISLSLSAGPEFNSSGAVLGGKTGFSAGIGFSVGIAKRITLQTGLKYSMKDYAAENYEYKFRSAKAKDVISRIDAACVVLEIPLQASYTVLDDTQKSIDLNVGMSSYFMLKEDYTYRYNAGSGIADRFQEYKNKNQHYFGVADLSATYYIKLKKEGLKLGLEPYVKIPLTGVGEGKVNLKSSGISLKLRYDLGKKNN